ncbi:PorP/SprF family type IX secretion system membrane protein [Tenacibaculum amylolyticum]|uniref:PorP/SprF family type IX secretion system membrane protein n=1 Tax=Tenacibaculum amylolyticum TaxID=104269 RepID=UPI0038B50866
MKGQRKKILLMFMLFLSVYELSFSQQDPQYTQYMYNTMSVNPAYAGSNGHTIITALARTQWVGIQGAPDTQTLSYDTTIGYSGVGLGVNLTNDQIGPSQEIYLDANVSYTVRLSEEGNLSFGLKLGGRHLAIDWSKGTARQQERPFSQNVSEFLPTIGAGIYYHKSNWYAGIAVPNILRTDHYDDTIATIANGDGDIAEERLHFFGIAGYVFDLNANLKFKPATLVKVVNGAPLSLDISANFLFNEKVTGGVAWRWDDSISALLGLQATDNLHIGFAYDLTTSNYSNFNSGTYELMVKWEASRGQVMKSPRFF